jgi:homogentisate 1,2-dioxygenase
MFVAQLHERPRPRCHHPRKATNARLAPVKQEHTLAFMFETRFAVRTTAHAMNLGELQHEYYEVWQGLKRTFTPPVQ